MRLVDLVLESSKRYFYAGLLAIVFFSLATGFTYMALRGPTPQENPVAEVTLVIQDGHSGAKSFSSFVGEETLFSGRQARLTFSSAGDSEQSKITCTIGCERLVD